MPLSRACASNRSRRPSWLAPIRRVIAAACGGGDRDIQGALASVACTDEQSPRELDRFARRFARRETRVPLVSLRIGGPRALRCTRSRRIARDDERTVRGCTPRRASTRRKPRNEGGFADQTAGFPHQEHTRHEVLAIGFGSECRRRSERISIATPESVNSALGNARTSSNGEHPHDDA